MFEAPLSPKTEKEIKNHFPSLRDIRIKLTKLIGHDNFQEFIEDENADLESCPTQYEVVVVEPNGDESLYAYQCTDTAQIFVAYYRGKITNDNLIGGEILAVHDSITGRWNILQKNPQGKQLEPFTPQRQIIATDLPRIAQETNEHDYRKLLEQFANAEAVFGTISLEETIQRETDDYEAALERRAQTRPLLNGIYTELTQLNDDHSYPPQLKLTAWHASGQLTEAQFNELNSRRKHLANLVGALNGGKIRHDLNP